MFVECGSRAAAVSVLFARHSKKREQGSRTPQAPPIESGPLHADLKSRLALAASCKEGTIYRAPTKARTRAGRMPTLQQKEEQCTGRNSQEWYELIYTDGTDAGKAVAEAGDVRPR